MRYLMGLLVALSSACGGNGNTNASAGEFVVAPFASGSRLRAVYNDGGDGAVRHVAWWDNQLDIYCSFARDPSSTTRCLPFHVNTVYLDAACTELAAVPSWCGSEVPEVVSVSLPSDCSDELKARSLHAVGDSVRTMTFYEMREGCEQVDLTTEQTVYRLTPADPSIYVSATTRDVAVNSELAVRLLETADGAHQTFQSIELAADRSCRAVAADGQVHCMSGNAATHSGSFHTDTTCTAKDVAVTLNEVVCEPPSYVLSKGTTLCGANPEASLMGVGAALETPEIRYGDDLICQAADDTYLYWRIVELDRSPPRMTALEVGTGRLKAMYVGAPDRTPMVRRYGYDLEWTDAQTGGCHLHKTESHGTRCLTDVSAQIRDYFRDAACTEPLIKVGPGSCEGTRPTGLAVKRRDPADACSHALVYEARKIEGEYTGQVYAPSDGASCSERSRRAGESFFELSDKLPLDSFPAVNRVQE